MVLQKHYRRLERSWSALGTPVGLQWYGLRVGNKSAYVKAYSMQLDAVQQAVINCARLLSLTEFWRDAWQNECDAVFADMQAVKRFAAPVGRAYDSRFTSAMQQVASLRSMVDGLEGRLFQGQIRPVEGLDVLGRVVSELRQIAERFVDGVFAGMSRGERRRCRRRYKKYMNSWGSSPRSKISMMLGGAQIGRDGQEVSDAEGLESAGRRGGVPRMSSTVRMLTRSPAVDEVAVTGEGVGALSVSAPVMDVYNGTRCCTGIPGGNVNPAKNGSGQYDGLRENCSGASAAQHLRCRQICCEYCNMCADDLYASHRDSRSVSARSCAHRQCSR